MINTIIQGDCLEVMKTLEDNSVDAIVTDPPYGLSFMGKEWDGSGIEYNVEMWSECLRILKPGGYLLAFGGTRTCHRMTCAIEDAGFEIRDMIFWTYASGFPKSTNIFKQLQKQCTCGNMEAYEKKTISSQPNTKHDLRPMSEAYLSQTINSEKKQGEVLQSGLSEQGSQIQQPEPTENVWEGQPSVEGRNNVEANSRELSGNDLCEMSEGISTDGEKRRLHNATQISDGSTPEQIVGENGSGPSQRPQPEKQPDREPCAFCKQFGTQALGAFGFGSALKPACEPITVARKPLSEKNLALNVLKWGTGGINIDECRIKATSEKDLKEIRSERPSKTSNANEYSLNHGGLEGFDRSDRKHITGRFPSNLIHDGSNEVVSMFPNTKPTKPHGGDGGKLDTQNMGWGFRRMPSELSDNGGSASRFFYCAKASKSERNKGCEELEEKQTWASQEKRESNSFDIFESDGREKTVNKNNHPTVKPIALMEYLVKLVSREGAVVLDPFAGSGSTLIACKRLGRKYIGIELEPDYVKIAEARIKSVPQKLFI